MKKIAASLLVLVFVLSLFASCAPAAQDTPKDTGKTYKIGVVVKTLSNNEVQMKIADSAKAAGEKYGCEVLVNAPQDLSDYAEQLNIVENMISQKVDLLVLVPVNSNALCEAVERCNAAGIPVITSNTNVSDHSLPLTFIGTGNEEASYIQGKWLCEKLGGKGNVVYLEGKAGDDNAMLRKKGFYRACEEYPDITIIFSQDTQYSQEGGVTVMENALAVTHDIQGVGGASDTATIGAAIAAEDAGLRDNMIFVGFDGASIGLKSVSEGTIDATVAQYPDRQGAWAVQLGLAYLTAGMKDIDTQVFAEWIDSGCVLIDQENLDQFYTE